MLKKLILLACSFCCGVTAISFGQEQSEVSGKVSNAEGPMPGVSVTVKGSTQGTTTDENGAYKIQASADAVLVFSFIGYPNIEEPVNGRATVEVLMQAEAEALEEVVVTALGIERDTRTLGYATQAVDGSKLNEVRDANANVLNSLTGKIAGAVITPAAGGPGSAARIVLRGNRSISGSNNALIIVDGVPIDNSQGTQASDENGGYVGSDGANNINPDDIESVNVLKGPSAAALYGSRAANGAIMINTKKGIEGPVRVSYNGGVSVDQPQLMIPYQNTYGRGSGGEYAAQSGFSWGPATQTYPDNVKDFFNTATSLNNSVSISGGSEKVQGYASYANNHNQGIMPGNRLNRNTMNLRVGTQLTDRLTTDAKITYLNQKIVNKPRLGEVATVQNAYIMPRDVSPEELADYEIFNDIGQPVPNREWPTVNTGIYMNPNWFTNRTSYNEGRDRVTLLASAKYQLLDWLSVQGRFSLDRYNNKTDAHFYEWTTVPTTNPGGHYYEIQQEYQEQNVDLLVSGHNSLSDDLEVTYNLGGSVLSRKNNSSTSTANGLIYPNLFYLNYASTPSMSNSFSDRKLQSIYGNVQFGYKEFLYLDVSARNDWSSTLPSPYSFFYPSAGLSAILSDMMEMPSWISFAKLRASYTQVGNDANPYLLRTVYSVSQGGTSGFISRGTTMNLADLKPEQTQSWEAGLEWRFLNDRLGIDATFYKTNTKNQLLTLNLPTASGFANRYLNAGNVENKGLEISLTGTPVQGEHFNWTSTLNFARNINTIIALDPDVPRSTLGGSDRLGRVVVEEGGAYGDIYGRTWARDDQGRYLVSPSGTPVSAQSQYIGNYNPKFNLGWSNNLQYKNFSLSLLIDGRVGGVIISGTDAYMGAYGLADYTVPFRDGGLVLPGVLEDGTPNANAIDAETFWSTVGEGGRAGWAEFFAYENTNFRLREASLGYDFNLNSDVFEAMQLSLVAHNLFFLYRGKALIDIPGVGERKVPIDPETSLGSGNSQGLESGLPPGVRSFGLNLKLFF